METLLIIVAIVEFIVIGGLSYAVYNLLKKLDFWEEKYKLTLLITERMVQNMNDVDVNGAFESDDEVGSTFQELKSLVNEYRNDVK